MLGMMRRREPVNERPRPARGSSFGGRLLALAGLLVGLCPGVLQAHATGENYVWVNVEPDRLSGRFEIRLSDLRDHLGLEISNDPSIALADVERQAQQVWAYLDGHFSLAAEGERLTIVPGRVAVEEAEGLGRFAQFSFDTPPFDVPRQIDVANEILFESDRFHRSLLCIQYDKQSGQEYGEEFTALIFSGNKPNQVLDLDNIEGLLRPRDFIWQGVIHIWFGFDHVLFLVALLLTAVVVWKTPNGSGKPSEGGRWEPLPEFKTAFWNIIKIVTAFTVAHSITLSLAALDIVRLPSRLVESIIALSIVVIAINNLRPRFREGWVIVFLFGLFHVMGFASVMGELPFRMGSLVRVILAFNIGVELGQLAIVAVLFPLLFAIRRLRVYQPGVLVAGSIVIGALSAYWFVERAFNL